MVQRYAHTISGTHWNSGNVLWAPCSTPNTTSLQGRTRRSSGSAVCVWWPSASIVIFGHDCGEAGARYDKQCWQQFNCRLPMAQRWMEEILHNLRGVRFPSLEQICFWRLSMPMLQRAYRAVRNLRHKSGARIVTQAGLACMGCLG